MIGYSYSTVAFQSTSPVWGMTDVAARNPVDSGISIHIPRVGDDDGDDTRLYGKEKRFQSTSPVWGMTSSAVMLPSLTELFQSTSPVWGMT